MQNLPPEPGARRRRGGTHAGFAEKTDFFLKNPLQFGGKGGTLQADNLIMGVAKFVVTPEIYPAGGEVSMSKKRILALFLSALLSVSVLAACGQTEDTAEGGFGTDDGSNSGTPIFGGELVVGVPQDLGDSLDPYQMVAAGTREVLFNVYEGLVKPNADGDFEPAVAEGWELSDDGLTYTFTLREGVKFHNGADVTVDDVLYSYETCAATTVIDSLGAALSNVKEVKADGNSVVITLAEPSPDFLSYAAMVYIVPAGYSGQATSPVGTGPFKFVSRSVQDSLVLEKFADYYGTPVYLDKVTVKVYEDNNAKMTALGAGSLDLAIHMTADQLASIDEAEYKTIEGTMNLAVGMYLNHAVKPLDNEQVRQAMNYAVDAQYILDMTSDGAGALIGTSMYPAFGKYFDESLASVYSPDLDKAKALMEEAGYPNGFNLKLTIPSNYSIYMSMAEVLEQQLGQIGVKVTIEPVEWGTWISDVYTARNFESTIIGFDAATLSAGAMLNRWMSTDPSNMINYRDPTYDELMAKAMASTDDEEQTDLYKQAAARLNENAANLYIEDMADFVVMKHNVAGYQFYPLYVMDLSKIYFTE